ncbi:hypothetical protein GH714_003436 [Hevea brasiliensis]|uniref:Uncharacterized protein n=1 Tax=Hevea brasiliensis TaxID=3981 RepID=A0A6A6KGC3_HEVBR|nr:hypothetical protein GH714_003436 [Hevea brasiliensis]
MMASSGLNSDSGSIAMATLQKENPSMAVIPDTDLAEKRKFEDMGKVVGADENGMITKRMKDDAFVFLSPLTFIVAEALVESHDIVILELSGAWEPSDRSECIEALNFLDLRECGFLTWDKNVFGNVRKSIEQVSDKIAFLQQSQTVDLIAKLQDLNGHLTHLLKDEETMWMRRSWVNWLKDGDKNSGFSHQKATQCKRQNRIDSLSDLTGNWVREQDKLRRLHGVKLPAPPVSHLFVADDNLLFGRATPDEADAIRSLLTTYERASGQQINMEKSELTTSKCVYSHLRSELRGRIGDRLVDQSSKYLFTFCALEIKELFFVILKIEYGIK